MRKLVREKQTNRFLREDGGWTTQITQACDFLHNDKAQVLQASCNTQKTEWLYVFDFPETTQYDFSVRMF